MVALRLHGYLPGKPEAFTSTRTHTHLGSGAESVSGPWVSQASRQTAADQGRRHVSLFSGVTDAHAR